MPSGRKENYFRTQLFKPSKIRNENGTGRVRPNSITDTAQDSYGLMSPTSSFRFDPAGSALKNTQQLNIDFSKFENHCFFNSARNKVHTAIEKIINHYPFDGTRAEYEKFLNEINGFEKYVFDRFPKNVGFLNFTGTHMSVKDYEGNGAPTKATAGLPKIDFESGPFSIEFSVFVPSGSINDNEVLVQRLENNKSGFTIGLSSSHASSSPLGKADLIFSLTNASKQIQTSMSIDKGVFNHVCMTYDRGSTNKISTFLNGQLSSTSSQAQIGNFNFIGTTLNIASGTRHNVGSFDFHPQNTFSGSMDEFRFFTIDRTPEEIKKYMSREMFAQKGLQLYFRFNEPSGSFDKNGVGNSSLVLDYSGNGMHTKVTNFDIKCRNTGTIAKISKPVLSEDSSKSPVLFPSFKKVQNLANELMTDATSYDFNNPNLITRLVPRHYLDDSAVIEGLFSADGELSSLPGMSSDQPGGNQIKQSQIVSSILFMWAEVFDEIKMFIDEAGRLLNVDYVDDETISSHLLPFLANYQGFSLPTQFNSVTIDQYLEGRQLTVADAESNLSLQNIQNTIWRRILSDLPTIRKTKGTHSSFRSVLRNMGINPDGPFKIREYGGSKTSRIDDTEVRRREVASMLNFTGSLASAGTIDGEGKDPNRPLVVSPFLSASRTEKGYPQPRGTLSSIGSSQPGDGLFTSGSWTVEGVYKFESKVDHPVTQSLMRIHSTGSSSGVGNNWLLYNVVATKDDKNTNTKGSLTLYGSPNGSATRVPLRIVVPKVNIFDGDKWFVSFGRERNDKNLNHSSSYFLRVGKKTISNHFMTQSVGHYVDFENNPLNVITTAQNASGAFLTVGSMSLGYDGASSFRHLNSYTDPVANYLNFTGKLANLRFFTKSLTRKESLTHLKNFKSVGVENPLVNYSFTNKTTGSFERLRVDLSMDQIVTESLSSGRIQIFDFSQNLFHGSGTGFDRSKRVIHPETFDYGVFEPKFETSRADNKIRIRSYKSPLEAENKGVRVAPVYELPQEERPDDDRRFEIEISSVQALNEDILNIFSTLDFFDNAIGDPELLFSSEYRSLRNMRRIYFNRLEDKISIKKFFEFFKWFDMTVGDIFEELVPRTSRYLGTNFVIENHILERSKVRYNFTDMYIGEIDRRQISQIYLQLFAGNIKKF